MAELDQPGGLVGGRQGGYAPRNQHGEGHLGLAVLHHIAAGVAVQPLVGLFGLHEQGNPDGPLDPPEDILAVVVGDLVDGHRRRILGELLDGLLAHGQHVFGDVLGGLGGEVPGQLQIGALQAEILQDREDVVLVALGQRP